VYASVDDAAAIVGGADYDSSGGVVGVPWGDGDAWGCSIDAG
jgi:hypothetical protein